MELYGIRAGLGPSESQTPVSLKTNIVFIGSAASNESTFVPTKCTSFDEYVETFGKKDCSLCTSANYAFNICGINEAWFINCGGGGSGWSEYSVTNSAMTDAIDQLDAIYRDHGVVPNIVVLPYNDWREHSSDGAGLATYASTKCEKIADYFKAQVFYDVEVLNENIATVNLTQDITQCKFNKNDLPDKQCKSENCLACVGYFTGSGVGLVPLSVVAACDRALEDAENAGGVPYRSVGNLRINGADKYVVLIHDRDTNIPTAKGLELNTKDICDTMAANGFIIAMNRGQNRFYTWGDHTAAVETDEGTVDDERARFDSYIAIAYHIVNRFILKWMNVIDSPMTLALRNDIINEEQNYLDYLVSIGALIGAPKCEFRPIDNTTDTVQRGQFHFTNINTYTVPAKYIDLKVVYTSAGIESYITEGE